MAAEALPPIIHIAASSPAAAPLRATLALLGLEAGGGAPGEAVVVDRLADILLVQALRAHLAAAGPEDASWLAGLADPRIGKALRCFHDDVAADWTVAQLAAAAGMSRSSFAERFRARVGMAPLDYLTRWRMVRGAPIADRYRAAVRHHRGPQRLSLPDVLQPVLQAHVRLLAL